MNRLVSLLLIPLLMLGHLLPHSHVGTGTDQPDDHAARPHIHLASHDSGTDSHQHAEVSEDHEHAETIHEKSDAVGRSHGISGQNDHYDDAIYLANSPSTIGRSVGSKQIDLPVAFVIGDQCLAQSQTHLPQRVVPPQRRSSLPIYLLTASLRL